MLNGKKIVVLKTHEQAYCQLEYSKLFFKYHKAGLFTAVFLPLNVLLKHINLF